MDPHPAERLTLRLLSLLRLLSVNGTFVSPTLLSQPGDCFPEPFWPHILYILVFLIALAIVTLKEMKQDCNGFHKENLNLCSWSKDAANKVFLQRSECLVNRFYLQQWKVEQIRALLRLYGQYQCFKISTKNDLLGHGLAFVFLLAYLL